MKTVIFAVIVAIVLSITGYLVWSTVSKNIKSVTGGPVHYHADFEIYNCGQKVDLIDPAGLENKLGSALLHEHNDNRIHVEGPVLNYQEISLGGFFKTIGGELTDSSLKVPTNNGTLEMTGGQVCHGQPAQLQVFVYQTKDHTFHQQKLANPVSYVISPHSQVPPGDCIIIEFDTPKDKTDKLCNFYQIAKEKGELIER